MKWVRYNHDTWRLEGPNHYPLAHVGFYKDGWFCRIKDKEGEHTFGPSLTVKPIMKAVESLLIVRNGEKK